MLLRRKVCAAVVIAGILFLMLASQSIQKRNFLPLSIPLPVVWATPTGQETGEAPRVISWRLEKTFANHTGENDFLDPTKFVTFD